MVMIDTYTVHIHCTYSAFWCFYGRQCKDKDVVCQRASSERFSVFLVAAWDPKD